jgi:uncharacterized YigZ family protein
MIDLYKTIAAPSIGEFKDRGSKFIAYAYPVYTEEEWQEHLNTVKKEHFKARHHCFAFRIGLDKNNFRANDDGEPSGTAGRPILGQIDSFELTNVFVVVVRYFGGTKLGVSGLINAYKNATIDAFQQATIIEKTVEDIYKISFHYALMSNVMNAIKKLELEIVRQEFADTAFIDIAIRQSEIEQTISQLRSHISGIRIEEIDDIEIIEGLELDYLFTR